MRSRTWDEIVDVVEPSLCIKNEHLFARSSDTMLVCKC